MSWIGSTSSGSMAVSRLIEPRSGSTCAPVPPSPFPPLPPSPVSPPSSSSPQAPASRARAKIGTNHRRCLMVLHLLVGSLLESWWARSLGLAVDPGAVGGVEEVQAVGVDHELDLLALADPAAGGEAGEDVGALLAGAGGGGLEGLDADVGGELLGVLGHGRRRVDGDVDHHVGAEGLAQVDGAADAAVGRGVADERGVLHVLGPDAEH